MSPHGFLDGSLETRRDACRRYVTCRGDHVLSDRISKCVGVAIRLATSAKYPEKNGGATPGVPGSARCGTQLSRGRNSTLLMDYLNDNRIRLFGEYTDVITLRKLFWLYQQEVQNKFRWSKSSGSVIEFRIILDRFNYQCSICTFLVELPINATRFSFQCINSFREKKKVFLYRVFPRTCFMRREYLSLNVIFLGFSLRYFSRSNYGIADRQIIAVFFSFDGSRWRGAMCVYPVAQDGNTR